MSNKVDVIISNEGGEVIVLEVVETNDINKTIERKEYYRNFYKNVHVYSGIDFININNNVDKEDDFRKFNKLKKEINEKLKIPVSIKREDDFIIIAIPDSTNKEIYQRVFLLATMILDEKDFDKIAIIDDLNMEIPKEEYEKYYINN